MASTPPSVSHTTEHCQHCGNETRHDVAVELRTEGPDQETAAFSREPYRISTCTVCGCTTARRMNNA